MAIPSWSMMHLKSPQRRPIANIKRWQLMEAIEDIDETQESPYIILEDYTADESFMQTFKRGHDDFLVEYAEGTPRRQYKADHLTTAQVMQLFTAYLRRDPSYKALVPWKNITIDLKRELRRRKPTHRHRSNVRRNTGRG